MARDIEKEKDELIEFMESNIPKDTLEMIRLVDEVALSETQAPIITISAQGTVDGE